MKMHDRSGAAHVVINSLEEAQKGADAFLDMLERADGVDSNDADGNGQKAQLLAIINSLAAAVKFYNELRPVMVSSITLNDADVALASPGSLTFQLVATVSPSDASDQTLTWESDDELVATVSATGLLTAVGNGSATVTATANDGSAVQAECAVEVTGF